MVSTGAFAQRSGGSPQQRDIERQAMGDSLKFAIGAPSRADLGDQGWLRLSGGMLFIPTADADGLFKAFGIDDRTDALGLVMTPSDQLSIGVIRYIQSGFIRPEDQTRWKNDDILASLRDMVATGNDDRVARRLPPLEARDWVIPPVLDPQQHTALWSALVVSKDTPRETGGDVVINGVLLGRNGYFRIEYLTTLYQAEQSRTDVNGLLGNLYFTPGKTADDFRSGDPIADHGAEALYGISRIHKAVGDVRSNTTTNIFWVLVAGAGLVAGAVVMGVTILVVRISRNQRRRRR